MNNLLLFILLTACSRCFGVSTVGDLISSTVGTNANVAATDSTGRFVSTNIIHAQINAGAITSGTLPNSVLPTGNTEHFLDLTGSDANDGLTTSTAWLTISHAVAAATPGSTVALNASQVWPISSTVSLTNPGIIWTAWSPPPYTSSMAVISNANPLVNDFNLLASSNIFQNLVFVGCTNNLTNFVNYLTGGAFFCVPGAGTNVGYESFLNCTFNQMAFPIFAAGLTGVTMSNWFFGSCLETNCGSGFWQTQNPTSLQYPCGVNWTYIGCTEANIFGYTNGGTAGIISTGSSNITVILNVCHDAGQSIATNILGGFSGVEFSSNENSSVSFSESYRIHDQNGVDGAGFQFDLATSGMSCHDCYSHDNDGPGFEVYQALANMTFYNNRGVHNNLKSYTNSQLSGCLSLFSPYLTNFVAYSNQFSIDQPGGQAISFVDALPVGGWLSNNILQAAGGAIADTISGGTWSSNIYWGGGANGTPLWAINGTPYTSLAAYTSVNGEVGAVYANPQAISVNARPLFKRTEADALEPTNNFQLIGSPINNATLNTPIINSPDIGGLILMQTNGYTIALSAQGGMWFAGPGFTNDFAPSIFYFQSNGLTYFTLNPSTLEVLTSNGITVYGGQNQVLTLGSSNLSGSMLAMEDGVNGATPYMYVGDAANYFALGTNSGAIATRSNLFGGSVFGGFSPTFVASTNHAFGFFEALTPPPVFNPLGSLSNADYLWFSSVGFPYEVSKTLNATNVLMFGGNSPYDLQHGTNLPPAGLQATSGSPGSSTYYRGDGAWATPSGGGGSGINTSGGDGTNNYLTNVTTSGQIATNINIVSGQIAASVVSNSFVFSPFNGWRTGTVGANGVDSWSGPSSVLASGMDVAEIGTAPTFGNGSTTLGSYINFATTSSSGNASGWGNNNFNFVLPSGELVGVFFIQLAQTTTEQAWFGFAANPSGNTASDTLGGQYVAAFRYSTSASDTKWIAYNYNGSSTTTYTTSVAPDTNPHFLAVVMVAAGSTVFYIDGAPVATNANVIPTGQTFNSFGSIATTAASSVSFRMTQFHYAQHL